ncbi:MAG: VIT domain-containing protein [bacterium]
MYHRALLLIAAALWAAPAVAQPLKIAAGTPEAPFSLTASDGTGLALVGLDARAVVDGPLAFTELRLIFRNPEPRTIEGHFKVTMPDGAAISRFAMKINGNWMEGEVVEKQAARRAYEDALHRRQDPALLEQDSGNTFRARVFPIPANGEKEIIVSWSHELKQAGEAYRLPLLGLPAIEKLSLTALTASSEGPGVQSSLGGSTARYQVSKVEKTGFTPDQDWVVFGGAIPAGGDGLRNGDLAVARFVVPGDDAPEALAHAVILFDTSASRALDFEGRLAALTALVQGLEKVGVSRVEVIAFDQYTESVFDGAPTGFGDAALGALRRRGALGASSIEAAIAALEETNGPGRRVIFLTDGMVTAGERDMEKVRGRLAGLGAQGIERVDVVVDDRPGRQHCSTCSSRPTCPARGRWSRVAPPWRISSPAWVGAPWAT